MPEPTRPFSPKKFVSTEFAKILLSWPTSNFWGPLTNSNKIIKSEKNSWGLGPSFSFAGPLGPKKLTKPQFQNPISFPQTRPHSIQNHKLHPIKLSNLKIPTLTLGVWDLKTTFGPLEPKRFMKPKVQNPGSNCQDLILSRIIT